MKILLLGFGNVGREFATLLPNHKDINGRIVGIVTGSHGTVVSADGVQTAEAIAAYEEFGRFNRSHPGWSPIDAATAVESLDYDVLVELTTLSIERRGEPAASHIRGALRRKKHVVSANKGPIAYGYRELHDLAASSGCRLLFESAVMDGAPVFSLARGGLMGCTVTALSGILNSTSNFVLSQMELGLTMKDALARAQREGFAEADPRHDLNGWDAAAKICVLWNVLGGGDLTPNDVEREGMADLKPETIAKALAQSRRLKYVARVWRESGHERACVRLEEIPFEDTFATVTGTGSVVRIETDCMNPVLIMQEHPTLKDTAYGVLNDLLTIATQ
jgi:homoserine dehydrogenase